MLKEDGYDEFLAEKIQTGMADIANGRVHSLEECQLEWQKIAEDFAKETEIFEQEIVYA